MTLEIDYDEEAERIDIVLDGSMKLYAYLESDTDIKYSSGFSRIIDDPTHTALKKICRALLLSDS